MAARIASTRRFGTLATRVRSHCVTTRQVPDHAGDAQAGPGRAWDPQPAMRDNQARGVEPRYAKFTPVAQARGVVAADPEGAGAEPSRSRVGQSGSDTRLADAPAAMGRLYVHAVEIGHALRELDTRPDGFPYVHPASAHEAPSDYQPVDLGDQERVPVLDRDAEGLASLRVRVAVLGPGFGFLPRQATPRMAFSRPRLGQGSSEPAQGVDMVTPGPTAALSHLSPA